MANPIDPDCQAFATKLSSFYKFEVVAHPLVSALGLDAENDDYVAHVIFTLINLPAQGHGILYMEPVVEILVSSFAVEVGVEQPNMFEMSVGNIFRGIRHMAAQNNKFPNSTGYGIRESNPIYTFLFLTCADSGAANLAKFGVNAGFMNWAPFFVRRIRELQLKFSPCSQSYLYNLCLVARKLVVGYSETVACNSIFSPNMESRIRLAAVAINFFVGVNIHLTTESNHSHVMDLLFRDRDGSGKRAGGDRQFKGRKNRWGNFEGRCFPSGEVSIPPDEFDDIGEKFQPQANFAGECTTTSYVIPVSTIPDDYQENGEDKADYSEAESIGLSAHWYADPWTGKRRERGMTESMVSATRVMPWDTACITIGSIRNIMNLVAEPSCDEGDDLWKAVILLALFMGMNSKTIMKIQVMELREINEFDEMECSQINKDGLYFAPSLGILWKFALHKSELRKGFLPNLGIISLELPDVIRSRLPSHYASLQKIFTQSCVRTAMSHLRRVGEQDLRNLTLQRLSVTFRAYFHAAGLSQFCSDLISFQESPHLISQHYYIAINQLHLVLQWHAMINSLMIALQDRKDVFETIQAMARTHATEFNDGKYFIGAKWVPETSALRKHFKCLWEIFPHTKRALIDASDADVNAYMAYLYGMHAVLTGKRPLRDPGCRWVQINFVDGFVYIEDKLSRVAREARWVPISDVLSSTLKNHLQIHPAWFSKKIIQGYALNGGADSFLAADSCTENEQPSLEPVNPKLLDRLIANVAGEAYLPNIRNGFRHYLLSALHRAGVDQTWIDCLSGHRHTGREPEFLCSPISWEYISTRIRPIIEMEIIENLGLKVPNHG